VSSQLSMASDLPPLRLNPRPGVMAGKAAVIEAVAVPSHQKDSHLDAAPDEVINSHIDLRPENCDLPPFEDWVKGTLPIKPWYIEGPVIKGLVAALRCLASLQLIYQPKAIQLSFGTTFRGIFWLGWIIHTGIYKMVMSVGWNPYFNNAEKTIEPWLLHEFGDDFYGEDLPLLLLGIYGLRYHKTMIMNARRNMTGQFPIAREIDEKIHEDRRIAETALEFPMYSNYREDPYLKSSSLPGDIGRL
ncbi:hypothetical protein C3L33_09115, partial [Rhododendron williamsianum]